MSQERKSSVLVSCLVIVTTTSFLLCFPSLVESATNPDTERAECLMWSKLENRTLPLQNQGQAKCSVNEECSGFDCEGFYQGKEITFGMKVLPCQHPPGVQIYGYAPQFNAKNFSHIFTHKAEYEIPGALLNASMLPNGNILNGAGSLFGKDLKGRLEVLVHMDHDTSILTLGLNAKACMNSTCILSKPVFNHTQIPVPACEKHEETRAEPKVYSVCQMSDIQSCGLNQICQQTKLDSPMGLCVCLTGYSLTKDKTCVLEYEDDGAPRLKKAAFTPHPAATGVSVSSSDDSGRNSGTIAALVVSFIVVLLMVGAGIYFVGWTRHGMRLRARMTNTPYGDIVIGDRGQMRGSTATLDSNQRDSFNRIPN